MIVLLLAGAAIAAAPGVAASDAPGRAAVAAAAPASSEQRSVRERRLAYTAAIKARRPDLMLNFLAPEMVQLSSNGDAMIGRDAIVRSYSEVEFRDPAFIVYERTPDEIRISDNGRFAVERGHWRGRFRMPGGRIGGNSGLYQAGWIKRDGLWWIRTESYVRLHCSSEKDCPR